ncbi:Imidazole glycerol-phosphate synthase [Prochlorococcus marinus str. NATL1A]|uniref:imidazole glycerol-phosphate synthase n=1 Tax=Prochlorococcus marinus (strain NATL1A) TaxID=167555 RepID=A2C1S3_PROM1|nr:imidazole glycerol phosphate synthase cyclase subunit [Prochlorococcus marinus]ABM75433.1 Imidazole glycerol-phosphate synthase [Prochlorococcus marinus str. NATL1A]
MRIIGRLDVKNNHVIKGIHLEGLRKVGDPQELAVEYYKQGIEEIVFMDAVASLYNRNNLFHIIQKACEKVFVPIALGGGLRSLDDVSKALNAGADKVVINTALVNRIDLAKEIAQKYGSQCLVGSIEAKRENDSWRVYVDNGREPTKHNVVDWAIKLKEAGVGEILLTSIDQEGTSKGFDIELIKQINESIRCPIIASGGYGNKKHLADLLKIVEPSAIAIAGSLHYKKDTVSSIKQEINSLFIQEKK